MGFSENAMCAILLCSYLGMESEDLLKPLSLGEWNTLLEKLSERKEAPGVILHDAVNWTKKAGYPKEFAERIDVLVSRGANLAFELEELDKRGIQVITQFDADYPILLRRRLKKKMPPVLYYAGNISLAKKIGIAVVGSRNVDSDGMEFTRKLVEKASKEKLIIYSGGAKGVDTISESTAIQSGSAVVSFIADSLSSRIKKKQIIADIVSGNLLLVSDVKPDAGFSSARAMNRNKYVYASSYGAFVVSSDYNKGGTLNGAIEAMRNGWTKTLIWNNPNYNGNQKLIEKGGIPFGITDESIYSIITKKEETYEQMNLFRTDEKSGQAVSLMEETQESDIYNVIKGYIVEHLNNGMSAEDVSKNLNVMEGQMTIWLERLCNDRLVSFDKGLYKVL